MLTHESSNRNSDATATPASSTWEDTRCRSCSKLLCKNTRDALRPGQMIEIKCGTCNTTNYLVGRPEL